MIEVKFTLQSTEYDASGSIIDLGAIERKVETDNAHEPGLIAYDAVSIEMSLTDTSIATLFSKATLNDQIDAYGIATHYIYANIRKQIAGSWYQVFAGVVDYESIKWTDTDTVQCELIDRLSALSLLPYQSKCRGDVINRLQELFDHYGGETTFPNGMEVRIEDITGDHGILRIYSTDGADPPLLTRIDQDKLPLEAGEFFKMPADSFYFLCTECHLDGVNDAVVRWYPDEATIGEYGYIDLSTSLAYVLSNEFIGDTIHESTGGVITHFNLIKVLKNILTLQPFTFDYLGPSDFAYTLDAYSLLEQTTFEKHPLDAVKYIASIMRSYVYIDRNGKLVVKPFADLATQTPVTMSGQFTSRSESYFWDKLIDEIEITGQLVQDGVFEDIVSGAIVRQRTGWRSDNPTVGDKIVPRNAMTKELIVYPEGSLTAVETAFQIAGEYLDFYGKRRESISGDTPLSEDTVQIELTDTLEVSSVDHFVIRMSLNMVDETMDMEIVKL